MGEFMTAPVVVAVPVYGPWLVVPVRVPSLLRGGPVPVVGMAETWESGPKVDASCPMGDGFCAKVTAASV